MKGNLWRRLLGGVAAATLLSVGLSLPATPASAAVNGGGSYDNAAIADVALQYVGQWGGEACRAAGKLDNGNTGTTVGGFGAGQCRTFVNCVVYLASGHTQYPAGGGSDYFVGFTNVGGVRITDENSLVKGDIVQVGSGVHTFIIVGPVSGTTWDVVDSNSQGNNNEMVRHYHRTFTLDDTTRAFRMARVGFNAGDYIGHIVKWKNTNGQPDPAWIVMSNGHRHWIPDTATYSCMVNIGFTDLGFQGAGVLNQLPDDNGQSAHCPVNAPGARDSLWGNQGLTQNQSLTSGDGRFVLVLQGDHNLVEYGPSGRVVWATNRWTGGFLVLQGGDCNLVGYNQWGTAQWATNVTGSNCRLILQNDGNLVEYGNGGRGNGVIWATDRH